MGSSGNGEVIIQELLRREVDAVAVSAVQVARRFGGGQPERAARMATRTTGFS
jgi:hypothetical protein